MKIRPLLLASALMVGFASSSNAQLGKNACLTDKHNLELEQQIPGQANSRAILEQQIQQYISQHSNQRNIAGTVIKIPVVVHVVTETGCDGISKAQILNGLEVLNKDFRRQNADTVNTRPIFKPVAADTEIEFVLARKNPNGWDTEGIDRVTSPTANDPVNRDDVKIAAPAWPTDKYFNIWLVDKIYDAQAGANILGYAQFPHVQPLNTFGVVLVHTQWGKQGAVAGSSANSSGHNATHEIAHCLNLLHIESMNCTDADLVPDTPPSTFSGAVSTACNFTQNTCSNDVSLGFPSDMPDQIENYMSYSDFSCMNMFTVGQKMRMQATFNLFPHLQNLISQANAVFTGIDPAVVVIMGVPLPYFCANKRVCAGSSVTFSDKTYNAAATSWTWTFPGGTPATSTAQNPVVTYNTPGNYNVTLQVSNPIGSRTNYYYDFVKVVPTTNLINIAVPNYYVEGFEEVSFPVSATQNRTWEKATSSLAANPDNWTRVNSAYSNITFGTGTNSLRLQNANIAAGTVSTLISPNFSLQAGTPGYVFMEIAYAKKNAQPAEELKVYYSHDCGATWNGPIKTLTGNQMVTNGGAIVSNFVPTANEWRMEYIVSGPGNSIFMNAQHIMFKIDVTSKSGGNLYIDNFTIGSVLGTSEEVISQYAIKVFPNPLTLETGINFELKTAEKVSVKILDLVGNTVYKNNASTFSAGSHTISLSEKMQGLKAGMYLVQLNLGGKIANTKLLVQ